MLGAGEYDRIVVEASPLDGGAKVRAWCYVYSASRLRSIPGARVIPDGLFREG